MNVNQQQLRTSHKLKKKIKKNKMNCKNRRLYK